MLTTLFREPLVHFILAGFLLFIYFKSCSTQTASDDQIVVTEDRLLSYMQYQSKAFNRDVFQDKFAGFSEQEKDELIHRYIMDEALYREAVEMGLDQNDFVIKRRVIQKMEFVLNDFDESQVEITEDGLQAYYEDHKESYYQSSLYSFTHIFFNQEHNASQRAIKFLSRESQRELPAAESLSYGDRFLYHRNYSEKTISFLEGHFGKSFVEALEVLESDDQKWQGPLPSEHGQHVVKLFQKENASIPPLEEIKSVVKSDYISDLKKRHKQNRVQKLVDQYEQVIDL